MTHKSPTTHVGLFKWAEVFLRKTFVPNARCPSTHSSAAQRPSKTLHKSDERRHVSKSASPAWWLTLAWAGSTKPFKALAAAAVGIWKHLRVQSHCVFFSAAPSPFVVKQSLVLHRCTSASEVLDLPKPCDKAQPRLPEVDSTFSLFHELQFLHASLDLVRSLVILASWLQQLLQGGRRGGVGVSGGIGGAS